ncbi:MAG: Gfo/Idh/MocA family oxidoreductase, partial [Boseongicola sp.]|nr:Gfo/Idh/MocA family oxidoreductase [Boseongicola sp.]
MVISENRRENLISKHVAGSTNVAAPLQHFFIERYGEAFDAEIGHFVESIESGAPVPVGFEDGRLALLLADACFSSVAEGRTIKTSEIG